MDVPKPPPRETARPAPRARVAALAIAGCLCAHGAQASPVSLNFVDVSIASAGVCEFSGAARGTSATCPLTATGMTDGSFVFDIGTDEWQAAEAVHIEQIGGEDNGSDPNAESEAEDTASEVIFRLWFDPPAVVAYDYAVTGALFTSVEMPAFAEVPNPTDYTLTAGGTSTPIAPGGVQVFADSPFFGNTDAFRVSDISAGLQLDPDDDLAFPVALSFAFSDPPSDSFRVTITPTAVPGPASLPLLLGGLWLLARAARGRGRPAA